MLSCVRWVAHFRQPKFSISLNFLNPSLNSNSWHVVLVVGWIAPLKEAFYNLLKNCPKSFSVLYIVPYQFLWMNSNILLHEIQLRSTMQQSLCYIVYVTYTMSHTMRRKDLIHACHIHCEETSFEFIDDIIYVPSRHKPWLYSRLNFHIKRCKWLNCSLSWVKNDMKSQLPVRSNIEYLASAFL